MTPNDETPPPAVAKLIDRLTELGNQAREQAARDPAVRRTARRVAAGGLLFVLAVCAATVAAIAGYLGWHHVRKDHLIAANRCAMHDDCAIWRIEATCERGWLSSAPRNERFEERGRTSADAMKAFTPWEPDCRVVTVTHLRPLVDQTAALPR